MSIQSSDLLYSQIYHKCSPVYAWVCDDKKLELFKKGDQILYRWLNKATQEEKYGDIKTSSDDIPIDERISKLKKFIPKLDDNGFSGFSNPKKLNTWTMNYSSEDGKEFFQRTLKKIDDQGKTIQTAYFSNYDTSSDCEVSLVYDDNSFKWVLNSPSATFCLPLEKTLPSLETISQESIDIIDNFKRCPEKYWSIILKDFKPAYFSKSHTCPGDEPSKPSIIDDAKKWFYIISNEPVEGIKYLGFKAHMTLDELADGVTSLFSKYNYSYKGFNLYECRNDVPVGDYYYQPVPNIHIEPISQGSYFDGRIPITPYMWGVTLICYNGSTGDHAQIVIEGIKEDKTYFKKLFSFYDSEAPAYPPKDFTSKKINFNSRTQVWKVPKEKVREMKKSIKNDYNNDNWPPFCVAGTDSIFAKPGAHSCFTLSREKLKILGIDLEKSAFGWIATRSKNYTMSPKQALKANDLKVKEPYRFLFEGNTYETQCNHSQIR